jgi:hypothetical protein
MVERREDDEANIGGPQNSNHVDQILPLPVLAGERRVATLILVGEPQVNWVISGYVSLTHTHHSVLREVKCGR